MVQLLMVWVDYACISRYAILTKIIKHSQGNASENPVWSKTRISLRMYVNDPIKICRSPHTLAKTRAFVNVDTSLTSLKQWSSSLYAVVLLPLGRGYILYTHTCVHANTHILLNYVPG